LTSVRLRKNPLLLFVLLALAMMLGPAAVRAQPRTTSTLSDVQLIAEGPDQSVFSISISPATGSYSAVNDDPSRPALVLLRTSRGTIDSRKGFRGLVRSIDFEPSETGLAIRFNASAPAKVTAEASGPNTVLATVTKLTGAEAAGSRPVGSANESVVPATGLPQYVEPVLGEDGYELVMLKYADVSEVVGLLTEGITVKPNNVFIVREPGFGSLGTSGSNGYNNGPAQAAPDETPLGQAVDSSLAIDLRLNAIWIKGSPERIARIKAQIAMIDVPVDSVILETQFVELTETGARNLGIDLNNANGQLAVATLQSGQFVPYGVDPYDRLPSASLQAAIYAQIARGEGRILSKPRIAAQSGSTAKIITGDALPILTAITLSGVNGVSQQVQYVNVGVTLQIAPRVSPDGYVTSKLFAVVSSVTGYSQGYPTISQRQAETSASVRDGETFVIGGLAQENVLKTRSKVPLLGDVPLLGQAFRVEKSTSSKTELYIVITPRIVRHRRFEQLDREAAAAPSPTGAY
jgi:general secretion pathway protein D